MVSFYLRLSTEEQVEAGSLENQRTFAEDYARRHELPIYDFYADEGVSGTIPLAKRPQGARLLQDAAAGKFDTVLVYRLDRLGRDTVSTLSMVDQLHAMGVQVISMTEAFDTANPAGRLMLELLASFASYERQSILDRTRQGTQRIAKSGAWTGGYAPFGYRLEDGFLVIEDTPLVGIGYSPAQLVRWIFNHLAYDGGSLFSAATYLNELGVQPQYTSQGRTHNRKDRGTLTNKWSPPTIMKMVRSTTYKGIHIYGKGTQNPILRPCPAIVDEQTWQLAQNQLLANKKFAKRNSKREYLLSGLVTCAHCGSRYCAQVNKSENRYYKCNARIKRYLGTKDCDSLPIPAERVEASIWRQVEGFLSRPNVVLEEIAKRLQEREKGEAHLIARRDQLKQALAEKDEEKNLILGLYRRKMITLPKLEEQFAEIEAGRNALTDEIDALDQNIRSAASIAEELVGIAELLSELQERAKSGNFEDRQFVLRTLVLRIVVTTTGKEREVRVTYKFNRMIACSGENGTTRKPGGATGCSPVSSTTYNRLILERVISLVA
jgi:site-specific DNA recombinase